jgi:hypothetical protein
MMAGSNRDRVADALREALVSANVAGRSCEPANVADALADLAGAVTPAPASSPR